MLAIGTITEQNPPESSPSSCVHTWMDAALTLLMCRTTDAAGLSLRQAGTPLTSLECRRAKQSWQTCTQKLGGFTAAAQQAVSHQN